MDALLIPITLFVCVALMVLGFFYFQYRARFEYQHTVRLAMERGQQLTPELLERLGHGRVDPAYHYPGHSFFYSRFYCRSLVVSASAQRLDSKHPSSFPFWNSPYTGLRTR